MVFFYFMQTLDTKIQEIEEWLGPGAINFFGMPFANKDTQAEELSSRLSVEAVIISGGVILRSIDMPDDIRKIMESGNLIPSDRYEDMVLPFLGQAAFAGKPLILSAVGRMSGEEPGVISATENSGHPIKAAPYLHITEDEAIRRLREMPTRGRADDNLASLRNRFDDFYSLTMPVLDTYENAGLLLRVDAMDEKEVVFRAMVHQLHELALAS